MTHSCRLTRRTFIGGIAGVAAGTLLPSSAAVADGRSVAIGNTAVDLALDWLRGQGNQVLDLRGPKWNDVGSDALVIQGPHRGPLEVKGTASPSGMIRYSRDYAGWFDRSRRFAQADPAYAVDRLYKVAESHPHPVARMEARRLLADARGGTVPYQRIAVHGVGGAAPKVRLAGADRIQPAHFRDVFGSSRPLFPTLTGPQAVCRSLLFLGFAADGVDAINTFVQIENSYDDGLIDSKERERQHAASAFKRLGTWAGAAGGAAVGGLLAAARLSNPGGWAVLGALGIVSLSTAAGALIGRWAFEDLGTRVVELLHAMGGSLSSVVDGVASPLRELHAVIYRCQQTAVSVVEAAENIAQAMWRTVEQTFQTSRLLQPLN
jgi:hypothetical protein